MRTFLSRNRGRVFPILLAVMLIVVGSLWWTKTIAFFRSSAIVFSSEPFTTVTPGDPRDTSPAISLAFSFSDETVRDIADKVAQTHGGTGEDYESDLRITPASEIAGMLVTARGRTPSSAKRLANYGAATLIEMINEATLARTGQANVSFMLITQ